MIKTQQVLICDRCEDSKAIISVTEDALPYGVYLVDAQNAEIVGEGWGVGPSNFHLCPECMYELKLEWDKEKECGRESNTKT